MQLDVRWKETTGDAIDRAAFERTLQERLPPYLARLIDLPERLPVEMADGPAEPRAFVCTLSGEWLVSIRFPHGDPNSTHTVFHGDVPAHRMISLWEHGWEEAKSFYYQDVRTDPFKGWSRIRYPSEGMVSFPCKMAMEIACGLGDLDVANAYLDRALAIGARMVADGLLKRHENTFATPGTSDLPMEQARLDQAMMMARLWRHGEWDAAQAADVIARIADWYLEKRRKDMLPQMVKLCALSCLRFCYIAGDLGTAKMIWAKLKKTTVEQDMPLWAAVEREKSVPARAALIQAYLDELPRKLHLGGLIMNCLDYQADLAMAVLRLKQVPFEALRLAPLSACLRQKPLA
jgi:hypothetical protein